MSTRRSGSLASLREGNRRRVIDALRERGLASRAELARATDLSRSTISTIVGDLIESGLAVERDGQPAGETHAGRPGVMVALDSSAGLALAIDFGHRHLRVAVSDLSHTVLAEAWRELDVDHSSDEGLTAAAKFVDKVLKEAKVDRSRVIGAVMGLPAPINRATGTVWDSSILPGWVGIDAAAEASARLRLPVAVENDANLGALAELTWGAAKGRSDVAYIKVASGIGGAPDLRRAPDPRRRRHRRRDRPHRRRRRRPGLPLRQPRLPRDARLGPRGREPARAEPPRGGHDQAPARARRRAATPRRSGSSATPAAPSASRSRTSATSSTPSPS